MRAGLAQLKAFVDGARRGGRRSGSRSSPKGRDQAQVSSGTFTFQRPGNFRWSYEKPFEQLIVGDGAKLWIYDRDLNQVIVRKLDVALGSSPAALLAGDNALESNFDLIDAGSSDGLEFVDARPRAPDSGFERVRIGFRDNLPRLMELRDTFGNVTTLTFDRSSATSSSIPRSSCSCRRRARTSSATSRTSRSGQRNSLVRHHAPRTVRIVGDQTVDAHVDQPRHVGGSLTVHGSTLRPSACASPTLAAVTLRQNGDHVPHPAASTARGSEPS